MHRGWIGLAGGLIAGILLGHALSSAELAALDQDLASEQAGRWSCERAVATDLTAATDRQTERCEAAAAACATATVSIIELERKGDLCSRWLRIGPGPRIDR